MKNLDRMYIISWFGDSNVRSKRVEYHKTQVEWAKSQGLEVFVVPQFYNEKEYLDNVTYIDSGADHLLLPGEARNVLLKHFYESESNFAIFADNDAVLYTGDKYCDSTDFVSKFNDLKLEVFDLVDLFFPLNPSMMPFSKEFADNEHIYRNNFSFNRNSDSKGSFFVLKNLKKAYNDPIWYDCVNFISADRKIIPKEDVDFGCQMSQKGYSVYQLKNIVLKEMASTKSTWVGDDRSEQNLISKDVLTKKYNLGSRGKSIDFSNLYLHNTRPRKLLVPKSNSNTLESIF